MQATPDRAPPGCFRLWPAGPVCWRDSTPILTFSKAVNALSRRLVWNVRAMPAWLTRRGLQPTIGVSVPGPAPERDRALLGRVDARQAVEKRRLAGPVRTDHGEDLAASLDERDVREARQSAEAESYAVHLDHRKLVSTAGGG